MLITITTNHTPASDIGYLLHKNPSRVHPFTVNFGSALVFYPEVEETRCTVALLLHVDPIAMVRTRKRSGEENSALAQYVNDRPYCANSFMSVAIAEAFSTALNGRCAKRPELVEQLFPVEVRLPSVPVAGGIDMLEKLFQPLGYEVSAERLPLDDQFPEWGESRYFSLQLSGTQRVADLLSHLYVLIPVLDNAKHYFVGEDEVEKLLNRGAGWLSSHPQKELIVNRYLRNRRGLTTSALERLLEEAGEPLDDETEEAALQVEEVAEEQVGLHQHRIDAVVEALAKSGARRILDLGCGEGKLISALRRNKQLDEVTGMDVSIRALEFAARRLRLDEALPTARPQVQLLQGALTYNDDRLKGYDAAVLVEVIEHVEPERLPALENAVFGHARPETVIITTPNAEYNVLFSTLDAGKFRHTDHRFEWTRAEFSAWADRISDQFEYKVEIQPLGPVDTDHGAPSQLAVFRR